jgi:transcriptional regulator with XRE-family HTH domain
MKTEICSKCGKLADVVHKSYPFEEMGIPVELKNVEVIECPHCGNVDPIIPNMDGLIRVLAVAVLCSPRKLNGPEVRFLRKYVNKNAREFSRYLNVTHQHLSKLENDRYEITPRLDKLVRLLVGNMDPDLATEIWKLMKVIPEIEDVAMDERQEIRIDPEQLTYEYACQ